MKVLCVDTLATRLDLLQATINFRKEIKSHQFWSIRHNPGESMKKLSEFLISENIQVDKLAIALPGSLCSYHYFTVPFKKKKELRENVPFEIEERVPFDPENIYHAFQVLHKGKINSEIIATIIPKDLYHRFIDQIREYNHEPDVILPGPLSMAYSMLPLCRNNPNPIMAIEIRDITTYIVVCCGPSILVCRAYPMGLNHFVNPQAKYRGINQEEAYAELKNAGPQFPPGEIPDDLRDIIKPFFVEIKKTIMNIRSQGYNYIDCNYLSGYATEWGSFEELLLHEFQIPVNRSLLKEKYPGDDNPPSLITHGLLQFFAAPRGAGLINLRIHEHRAKQSIDELLNRLDTPQNQSLIKYTVGTLVFLFAYFILANTFVSSQKSKMETKLKETMKKMSKDLGSHAKLPKGKIIERSGKINATLNKRLKKLRTEVAVLKGSQSDSPLELLNNFIDRAPYDMKTDIIKLSIKEKTIDLKGNLFEGELEQYRKRLLNSGKVNAINKLKKNGNKFEMSVVYE